MDTVETLTEVTEEPFVKFIRLNTGEDIISEVLKNEIDEQEFFTLINPLKIIYVSGRAPGAVLLSFVEWVFPKICSEQNFNIYPDHILTIGEPTTDMINHYYDAIQKMEDAYSFMGSIDTNDPKKIIKNVENKLIPPTESQFGDIDEREISNEELEYIRNYLENMKNTGKRSLN